MPSVEVLEDEAHVGARAPRVAQIVEQSLVVSGGPRVVVGVVAAAL